MEQPEPLIDVQGLKPDSVARTPDVPSANEKSLDRAYFFVEASRGAADESASIDLKRLRRKIDRRILPMMFCCFVMQCIDKIVLNVSRWQLHML